MLDFFRELTNLQIERQKTQSKNVEPETTQ